MFKKEQNKPFIIPSTDTNQDSTTIEKTDISISADLFHSYLKLEQKTSCSIDAIIEAALKYAFDNLEE